jgi:hypothetical protein
MNRTSNRWTRASPCPKATLSRLRRPARIVPVERSQRPKPRGTRRMALT